MRVPEATARRKWHGVARWDDRGANPSLGQREGYPAPNDVVVPERVRQAVLTRGGTK